MPPHDNEPTLDEAARKRAIYDALSPRRRAFIDRIGYAAWEPFQEPKNPRKPTLGPGKRTAEELAKEFLHGKECSPAFAQAVLTCAKGLLGNDETMQAFYEFSLWFHAQKETEGDDTVTK